MTRSLRALLALLPAFLVASGCQNLAGSDKAGGSASGAGSTAPGAKGSASSASVSFTLASGSAAPGATAGAAPNFTLVLNAVGSNVMTSFCQAQRGPLGSDTSKACKCRYSWNETNLSDASVNTRTVDTDPTSITNFEVQCPGPDVYYSEIPDGSVLRINVVPDLARGNTASFTTSTLLFTKQPVSATGDFRDAEGRAYRNVFHYVCYDKFSKNLRISRNVKTALTDPTTNQPVLAPVANDFVTGAPAGAATSFSAQSYYYDFYVRSNEAGSINASNAGFSCPQLIVNGSPSYYPMDSSFALALQSSRDFSVSVTARTFVPVAGGPNPGNVLGYAAPANSDGTCPAYLDSSGLLRRTFRLRRYKALYPLRFDADGEVLDSSQPTNFVYVMDRPVDKLSQDPLRPITRLGPKPCPFSFKSAQFGQKCTTDASLAGWNIDGTQIDSNPSCPVYPPLPSTHPAMKPDGTLVIRPFRPFLSRYLEDTSFRACVFPSSAAMDPELVLSHDDAVFGPEGAHDFYCARHYPPAGLILPPSGGDPFDKAPGDCSLTDSAAAIKTDLSYSCQRTFDAVSGNVGKPPAAGCCQICSGPNCVPQGGGTTAAGRNAAFSPPQDIGNPPQGARMLPRSGPNQGGGCFDPSEN